VRLFTVPVIVNSASQLYHQYAVAFGVPRLKLLCFHVSDNSDESLVNPVWNEIFSQSASPTRPEVFWPPHF
jgi:hypothetical protein